MRHEFKSYRDLINSSWFLLLALFAGVFSLFSKDIDWFSYVIVGFLVFGYIGGFALILRRKVVFDDQGIEAPFIENLEHIQAYKMTAEFRNVANQKLPFDAMDRLEIIPVQLTKKKQEPVIHVHLSKGKDYYAPIGGCTRKQIRFMEQIIQEKRRGFVDLVFNHDLFEG